MMSRPPACEAMLEWESRGGRDFNVGISITPEERHTRRASILL